MATRRRETEDAYFEIRPIAIGLYIEGRVDSDGSGSEGLVQGYALAIGWWSTDTALRRTPSRRLEPELHYLIADSRRPAPIWLAQAAVETHFRSHLPPTLPDLPAEA